MERDISSFTCPDAAAGVGQEEGEGRARRVYAAVFTSAVSADPRFLPRKFNVSGVAQARSPSLRLSPQQKDRGASPELFYTHAHTYTRARFAAE